jgi:diguanylate cyclase (GGDEF)-like protein
MARTDELTGLFNFRHFSQALDVEMERTRRSGKPTALMVIDLDDFKSINDQYGHEFGNRVLAQVAGMLMRTVRRVDIACRYGGEEFTVVLPDTSLTAAVVLADRLRKMVKSLKFEIGAVTVFPTASVGVDIYTGEAGESWQHFLERADAYLLQAKRSGKNRVSSPELPASQGISADERDALLSSDSNLTKF